MSEAGEREDGREDHRKNDRTGCVYVARVMRAFTCAQHLLGYLAWLVGAVFGALLATDQRHLGLLQGLGRFAAGLQCAPACDRAAGSWRELRRALGQANEAHT